MGKKKGKGKSQGQGGGGDPGAAGSSTQQQAAPQQPQREERAPSQSPSDGGDAPQQQPQGGGPKKKGRQQRGQPPGPGGGGDAPQQQPQGGGPRRGSHQQEQQRPQFSPHEQVLPQQQQFPPQQQQFPPQQQQFPLQQQQFPPQQPQYQHDPRGPPPQWAGQRQQFPQQQLGFQQPMYIGQRPPGYVQQHPSFGPPQAQWGPPMPQQMPQRLPQQMPQQIPQGLPQQMPQTQPQTRPMSPQQQFPLQVGSPPGMHPPQKTGKHKHQNKQKKQQQQQPPRQQQQEQGPGPSQPQQQQQPTQKQQEQGPGPSQPQQEPRQRQQEQGPPGLSQPQQQPRQRQQEQGPPGLSQPQQQPIQRQQEQGPPGFPQLQQQPRPRQHEQGPAPSPPQQQPIQRQEEKTPSPPQPQQQPRPQDVSPTSSSSSKEMSPIFGAQGDRLKQLTLVKPGTRGRKIIIESNHLALNVGTLMKAIHYDVSITPDTPKSLLRDVMNLFGKKHYPNRHPAFDGRKNLYSPTQLPFGDSISDTIKVEGENRPKEFKVDIKFARTVDLSPLHDMLRTKTSPQDALQCLDIVLRNAPSNSCITAGRCFFTPPRDQIIQLGDGMEMYYGFYQSAIRGWKPLLNVDVAHKAFPSAVSVLDLICELGSDFRYTMKREDLRRNLSDNVARNLEKFIRQLKVKYEITGQSGSKRIHRVNGLGAPPSQAQFKLDDGKMTTVERYFENVKRCKLQYPHLPTIWVGSRERDSKILLPLEFCTVVEGQTVNRKMTENQTSAMIKKSATSTDIRKRKIMASLDRARYNNDPCIREFGFSVNNQFERLDARVLQPPQLLYANNTAVTPSRGVWRADRNRFLIGAEIKKWTIASVTRQQPRVEQLAEMIFRAAGPIGINMHTKATPPFTNIGGRQTLHDITEYFRTKQDFDLIFVVVPNSGQQYSLVKHAAEINVGCLTQCIKERTLNKLNPQTVGNILLKINSKMNGTNHAFHSISKPPIMSRPCMIMGADVTHPSPDAKDIPSVAAVTASHDPKAFQYNICWRLQPPKVEIIEDLCNITVEQLKFFYSKTRCKPERIIFFRDGVSEGQFSEVQKAEITAIQKACKKVQAEDFEPKITFLVVQKRHHTRLFPTNPRDSEDKNMNVPAGTCVDSAITNPTMQDFYLVSHASIQGVAKPTKYCTLWDDNQMSNDDIEELAYHLCHMFTRCNRSVSYPAPTYYAHLAAARAKVYIENDKLNLEQLKKYHDQYQIRDCIRKDKPMFFV